MGRLQRGSTSTRGFTLVELMIVVAIIGILAALAIYGVERYLATSKAAEAKQHVGAISRGAQGAYERTFGQSDVVNEGGDSTIEEHTLCGSATGVPGMVPQGVKYQPVTAEGSDFQTGTPTAGWLCLRFSITSPIYYQYNYNRNGGYVATNNPAMCPMGAIPCYEAAAVSDLNGDGSMFGRIARTGMMNPTTGALKASTYLYLEDEAN